MTKLPQDLLLFNLLLSCGLIIPTLCFLVPVLAEARITGQ
jgi:hypothetical protein